MSASTICSAAKTIRQLLTNTKYKLDYYQREYSWKTENVVELIEDFTASFESGYKDGHEHKNVENYGHYFLGSVIISLNNGQRFIIDGQQRLTTLTLLLIRLKQLLGDEARDELDLGPLIQSMSSGGEEGFNLNVPERKPIMEDLYSRISLGANVKPESIREVEERYADEPESIRNVVARYGTIENHLKFQGPRLLCFVRWLLDNVYLSEITVTTDKDAYTTFETMNDRGVPLTPADMLRGYLLANITDAHRRDYANTVWRNRIHELQKLGKKEAENAIRAWLRSQHADSIGDFNSLGNKFHRWVRNNEDKLEIASSEGSENFIEREFKFYSLWYQRLEKAANSLKPDWICQLQGAAGFFAPGKPGLECVYYNALHPFTLQHSVLLSPLRLEDTDAEIIRKFQIVSMYLDIFIHRRIWNVLPISQNRMTETMFSVIQDIRGKSPDELADVLYQKLKDENLVFASGSGFRLHRNNRQRVRRFLARMTHYVEVQSERPSHFPDYLQTRANPYEVEHIWENHPERYEDEIPPLEFAEYRNRIGGLLLLPKKSNASYGDLPYAEKREHYLKENLLAQSLHERAYERNPGFLQFIEESGLPFQEYPEFRRAELDKRQRLYQHLAEQVWSPERLLGKEPQPLEPYDPAPHPVPSLADPEPDERIRTEIREFYSDMRPDKVSQLCEQVVELQRLIEEKGWELTRRLRRKYLSFYIENNRCFGVDLHSTPRFAVWHLTGEELEQWRRQCNFSAHYPRNKKTVYLSGTTVTQLRPIFEFAYRKIQGA